MAKGRLVIFSGPSGVGKDTLLNYWRERNPEVVRVVAYTTRNPREGEVDGVDYHFVSKDDFHRKAEAGEFLEWKEVHGNFYATPLKDMEKLIEDGKIAILKIDVQGALDAMERRPDALSIFILPPSWDELERRISDRGLDAEEVVLQRLENAKDELAMADRYDHQCVNDELDKAVATLEEILKGATV